MSIESFTVSWEHGEFTVLAKGAMCAPVTFMLGDGRRVQPFAIAPWEDDTGPEFDALPQLLKTLRGEWVCVPFGMPQTRTDLPPEWTQNAAKPDALGDWFHGPSANDRWVETQRLDGGTVLELEYPKTHPIEKLVRKISGSKIGPRLNFELQIYPRRDCLLPIGAHPVFKLPDEPGSATLKVDGNIAVHTYPVDAEIGISQLPHGAVFDSLEDARWIDGVSLDLSSHPLARQTEEIVMVSGVSGRATLENRAEGYKATVLWDPQTFANCNLWISNRGRTAYPWNGRFRGLGIEPVSAPFDLGYEVANTASNPLRSAGVRCGEQFKAGQVWTANYAIEVAAS